jgi:hypothetical protein
MVRAVRGPGERSTRLWWVVVLAAVLAVLGIALAGVLLLRPDLVRLGRQTVAVGEPVATSFGSFSVTAWRTTFVPDTQGPPSAAQHNGTRGSDQVQVWVRLTNTRDGRGLAYAPAQFRLIGGADGRPRTPDGSTLQSSRLPRGASIDGQVWFDLARGERRTGTRWLEYAGPDGSSVRVALEQTPTPSPSHGHLP